MKLSGLVQAVILMLLLASAASCEVSRTYFQRTFQTTKKSNSDSAIVKFMQADSIHESGPTDKNMVVLKPENTIVNTEAPVIEKETPTVIKPTNGVRTKRKRSSS